MARNKIAAYSGLETATPSLHYFAPVIAGGNGIKSIYSTYNALLIGGLFSSVDGYSRQNCAAYSLDSLTLSEWDPRINTTVNSILGDNSVVYAGGYFSLVDLLPHGGGAVLECPREMYTFTSTRTVTPTSTYTRTITSTITPTATSTRTNTATYTRTATPSRTMTSTPTFTRTMTNTPVSVFNLPFFDTFADDSKKWDYGIEWQRLPAAASSGQSTGYPDPSTDVSAGNDNYVAGTVIGGNMSVVPTHDYYYMTSSYINAGSASSLQLRFFRHLNTDWITYIPCSVDVYNGTSWVNLYMSDNNTMDSAWTEQVYDVTAYKNPQFRVRFGHSVLRTDAWTMSGWNIDDVYIGPPFTPTSRLCT
ncbi:MAG TPA: hypothetical protein P5511_09155, partial [Candidatus Goldiibacteriota bacterium]|nr:hypothetical protein [Candidatus Goldiibacteriota bacterium]